MSWLSAPSSALNTRFTIVCLFLQDSKIFSPANLRACQEDEGYDALVKDWMAKKYTLRYTGGLVPDVYQSVSCLSFDTLRLPQSHIDCSLSNTRMHTYELHTYAHAHAQARRMDAVNPNP